MNQPSKRSTVSPLSPPPWLPEMRRDLAGMDLSPEWPAESVAVPGNRALRAADGALRLLAELDLRPDRLRPSLDGGVSFAFVTQGRYAELEFLDDGEVVATCSSGTGPLRFGPLRLGLETTVRTLQAFLGG